MPSPTAETPRPAADDRTFRAGSYDDAVASARAELGDGATIVAAHRVRRGGIGGFFATDLGVEVVARPSADASSEPADQPIAVDLDEWRAEPRFGALAELLERELAARDEGLPPRGDRREPGSFEPLSVPAPEPPGAPPAEAPGVLADGRALDRPTTITPRVGPRVDTFEPSGVAPPSDRDRLTSAGVRPSTDRRDETPTSRAAPVVAVAEETPERPGSAPTGWAALEAMLERARSAAGTLVDAERAVGESVSEPASRSSAVTAADVDEPSVVELAGRDATTSSARSVEPGGRAFAQQLLAEEIVAERRELLDHRAPPESDPPTADVLVGRAAPPTSGDVPSATAPSGDAADPGESSGAEAEPSGGADPAGLDPLRRPAELAVTAVDEMVRRIGETVRGNATPDRAPMREITVCVRTGSGDVIEVTTRFGGDDD